MSDRIRMAALVFTAGTILAAGSSQASAQLPPLPPVSDLLTYEIRTVYEGPEGPVERHTPGMLFATIPVDVDGELTTGLAGADILVQLTIDAGRASLRTTVLPGAPDPLPVLVEAILADPRGGSDWRVAFGYDATADTAPAVYDSVIALLGSARITSFSLDVHTVVPGRTLDVIAEVFKAGEDGQRIDPQRGRIGFTPVPAAAHIGVLQGSDFGLQQSALDLVTDTPTVVVATIEDIQASRTVRGDVLIDRLPHTLSLLLTQSDAGQTTWSYRASARVDEISLEVTENRNGDIVDQFVVSLEDMATSAVLVQDTPEHATFQADSPIGALSAGVAKGRSIAWLDEPAYLYSTRDGSTDSLAFRVLGLRRAELGTGDDLLVDVTLAPGPFHVLVEDGQRTLDARILDLPSRIRVEYSSAQGRVDVDGSAPIGLITLDATDPDGVAGRATEVSLRLEEVPASLSFGYSETAGSALLDAHGGRIGLVTLDASDGSPVEVDPGFDGLVFEDTEDRYAFAVRLNGLSKVAVSAAEVPYSLELVKDPGPFLVRLNQGTATGRIEVLDLPSSLLATLDPAGSLQVTASAPIDKITAELVDPAGVAGRATRADALLEEVPTTLDLSWSSDDGGTIGADARGQTLGKIEVLLTSGPFETLPPDRDGVVHRDVADRYVTFARITGLRKVAFSQGPPPSIELMTTGGRVFEVDVTQDKPSGTATTTALLQTLPASVDVTFTDATTFAYTASAPMSLLTLDAFDPDGISGRADRLAATLQSLPTQMTVGWNPDGTITMDAHGSTLGLLEMLLTSGPASGLDPAYDGIVLRDLSDRYSIFARLTGLRKVVATQSNQPDVLIETTGNRLLRVDLEEAKGPKVEYTRMTLDRLPSSVRLRFTEGAKREVVYTASAATNSLAFETNSGDRWRLAASVAGPLPASLYLCQTSNNACGGSGRTSNAGSATFSASQHTTVNLLDCVRPLDSSCPGSPTDFIRIDNMRVRHMTFDGHANSSGESGHIFLNTNNFELTGYVLIRDGSSGFEAVFNPGFRSQNRLGTWSGWGLFKNKSGTITCNGSLSVRVLGLWIGVTSYLC